MTSATRSANAFRPCREAIGNISIAVFRACQVIKTGSRFTADCVAGRFRHLAPGDRQAQDRRCLRCRGGAVETRLRRYKRRLKSHYSGSANGQSTDVAYAVMAPLADDDEEMPENFAPAVVAESTVALKTMSVASAVIELDTKDTPVFVFRNARNDHLNIVYRRPDGNIGWIDPSTATVAQE